ncbi:PREDICTED: uncharacterized protein LOC109213342 isoform X2 [Nicotiana attenuata]|uniref:uncharacterized protein LOC109213342 isoform X2 n=1 Tax=Nicotiana attenuata TaxID=49451 RepID=UPI000905BD5B|nr:PREDICTED: uncharacterized protein LOC109213342 isoform X2 [Nicotiana attenuata]
MAERNKNGGVTPLLGERPKEPWKGGEVVKSIMNAGPDAIVTSFSLISSISATHHSSVADGISKGFGDYVSSRTQRDVAPKKRSVTEWDVINQHTPQKQGLLQQYQALGMDLTDANTLVNIFAKYREILVDKKMATEKGSLPQEQGEKPWKNGLITCAAFVVCGCVPLLAFLVLIPFTHNDTHNFIGSSVFSAVVLVLLGIAKAKIAGRSCPRSAAATLVNGAIAGAAAYGIGWTLRNVAGLED